MLNKEKHQRLMGRILQDIYGNAGIAPLLGFKGGTCAYFFYGLTRFSVDLDFDLFIADEETKKAIYEKIKSIAGKYGKIKDERIKRFTIFFLLSYGDADHNIKIEINTRTWTSELKEHYALKEYMGIPMLVANPDYLFAAKLAALTSRSETAMRDIYDIWFFAKNNWDINAVAVEARTGLSLKNHLAACVRLVERIKDNEILRKLGELFNDKEKDWIKAKLRQETVLLLKNYQSVVSE